MQVINKKEEIELLREQGFKAYIFDLDGTLLNTLPDLVVCANLALEKQGFPSRTEKEILSFVGNGGLSLMQLSVPEGTSQECVAKAFSDFKALYATHGVSLTTEYSGITEVVQSLKKAGKKLGVLSNKFDEGVQGVIAQYFPNIFNSVHGERVGIPRKPDPMGLKGILEELKVTPNEMVYFGDSPTDMKVAHAVEAVAVGVTWGFRSKEILVDAGADIIIDAPHEILAL